MPFWKHTLTTDGSHDARTGLVGIGIVIQERTGAKRRGPILDTIAECCEGIPVHDAERWAVFRALIIALERGYTHVQIRSDHNRMRKSLRTRMASQHGFDGDELDRRILDLAPRFVWLDFRYVPRRKNQLAHRLARQGRVLK
jgi:ribonuclease HI